MRWGDKIANISAQVMGASSSGGRSEGPVWKEEPVFQVPFNYIMLALVYGLLFYCCFQKNELPPTTDWCPSERPLLILMLSPNSPLISDMLSGALS